MSKKMTKITTSELILSAIFYLQQKNGVTAKEITKYICEKRGCAQKHMKENVKKALERATVKGIFSRNRGLYRINNGFGLNKILNKTKGRGKKTNKGTKAKETVPERKKVFQVRFGEGKRSEPMSLSEIVDERMNDDYDNRGFYIELPGSYEQDDEDDEDFEDTEDDEDDTGFFSDDVDEKETKTEPKTLFYNENVDGSNRSSDCNSFTDPFTKPSKEEYAENDLSEERKDEEKGGQEKETRDHESDISEDGNEQRRENFKETSENPSETNQCNDGNQSEDEDQDNEGCDEQLQEEMDWDCQLNDLECIDRLLEGDDCPVDMAQPKDVGSDIAWEKGMKTWKNNSRIDLSVKDDPRDSFEANHVNDSTR